MLSKVLLDAHTLGASVTKTLSVKNLVKATAGRVAMKRVISGLTLLSGSTNCQQ
jgi:hypothetical protein